MSLECPNGHGRQNVIANINVEGRPIKKGSDVHIQKLACQCQVGGPKYQEFLEKIERIRKDEAKQLVDIREKFRLLVGKEFQKYQAQEA
jgi:hypothetical protein